MNYDVETIKQLVKVAGDMQVSEAKSFLLGFLEKLVSPSEFEQFLADIGQD